MSFMLHGKMAVATTRTVDNGPSGRHLGQIAREHGNTNATIVVAMRRDGRQLTIAEQKRELAGGLSMNAKHTEDSED